MRLVRDWMGFHFSSTQPVSGQTRERIEAAVAWIMNAQRATPDGGVPVGYFPCNENVVAGWMPSYPETTGYIIQSLVEYAGAYAQPAALERAREMAHWEVQVQMGSGAVQGGPVCEPPEQRAAIFNTGMVLQGWTALLAVEDDADVLRAAGRAADFLVADQAPDGHFRSHGPFVTASVIKTYNCLCAWALHRYGDLVGEARYTAAAVRAADAALREQSPNGWFANNCLTHPLVPLTHTIGYTLQGLLETGLLAGRDDIVAAARHGADALLAQVEPNGRLAGRFDAQWQPAVRSVCLTGSAQVAIVAYRLYEQTGEAHYREHGDRLVDFLKATQDIRCSDPGIRGALAGSFPLTGEYMTWGYPNWATKYLLDALMLQDRLNGGPS